MITLSRLEDKTGNTINEIEKIILSEHKDDEANETSYYTNWNIEKCGEIAKIGLYNEVEIEYECFTVSYVQKFGGMIDTDNTYKDCLLIVYSYNDQIKYIINRGTDSLQIIRKILFYTGKGEVARDDFQLSHDLFVWMISKVYNGENVFISSSNNDYDLNIDCIRGFKGYTEDKLTAVTAKGEAVMNIISALSFLIESKHLNQVTLDLQYRNHNNLGITIKSSSNSILFDEKNYLGVDLSTKATNNIEYSKRIAFVFMTIYNEIIPIILQNYLNEIGSNSWNNCVCVEFLKKVAEELSLKINSRISDLET